MIDDMKGDMKKPLFTGSGTALITPFYDDMRINYDALGRLVDYQVDNGTAAIIACGTTSEASTMTEEEHLNVIDFIIKRVNGRIPVIAGTGSNDTKFCTELSLEAKRLGADGLLIVTPYYNKTSQKGLVAHFSYIADAVKLPIILYNVPSRTGMNILPQTYSTLADHPYIVAIKEANGDLSSVAETIALCGDRLAVYSGVDELTLPMMAMGGKGVISVFANALPKQMADLTKAVLDNDYSTARSLANMYYPLMKGFFMDVNPVPVKEAMNLMNFNCGPCRLPLTSMTERNRTAMKELLTGYRLI